MFSYVMTGVPGSPADHVAQCVANLEGRTVREWAAGVVGIDSAAVHVASLGSDAVAYFATTGDGITHCGAVALLATYGVFEVPRSPVVVVGHGVGESASATAATVCAVLDALAA